MDGRHGTPRYARKQEQGDNRLAHLHGRSCMKNPPVANWMPHVALPQLLVSPTQRDAVSFNSAGAGKPLLVSAAADGAWRVHQPRHVD